MGPLTDAGTAPLIAAVIFALLAYFMPADHRYETVDLEWVSTRRVFIYLAIACLAAWVAWG